MFLAIEVELAAILELHFDGLAVFRGFMGLGLLGFRGLGV